MVVCLLMKAYWNKFHFLNENWTFPMATLCLAMPMGLLNAPSLSMPQVMKSAVMAYCQIVISQEFRDTLILIRGCDITWLQTDATFENRDI